VDPTHFGYGDLRFSWGDHICAIFDDPSQQAEVMGGFIAQGLRATQRCVWVGPASSAGSFREMLAGMGGDLPTLEGSGQLVIVSDVDFYLRDDLFDPDRTLDLLRVLLKEGQRQGYRAMRIATDVSWLRGHRMDPSTWESFEGRLTQEVSVLPVVLVCQYDRRQVSRAIIEAAFRTHPIVILGGTIHQNPLYVGAVTGPASAQEVM